MIIVKFFPTYCNLFRILYPKYQRINYFCRIKKIQTGCSFLNTRFVKG